MAQHVKAIIRRQRTSIDCRVYVNNALQYFKLPYGLGSSSSLPEMTGLNSVSEAARYLQTNAVKNDVKKACAKYLGMIPDEYEIILG